MASRASLAYLGQEEIFLTGQPELTYYIEKYPGFTPFASRVDEVQFQTDCIFGAENYIDIPRSGDIITNMYLDIEFPSGYTVLESAGTLMIRYVELYLGGDLLERLWGEYIEILDDLTVPATKQTALRTLTGKGTATANSRYRIPLPFSIIDKGYPLCAIEQNLQFRITFNPGYIFTNPSVAITTTFGAHLHIEYTYISEEEIKALKARPYLQFFEQVQKISFFAPQGSNFVRCQLGFVNPVKELFFVIQNDSARGYDYTTDGSTEQLQNLVLYFNSTDRISSDVGTPVFLRNIQALEFHTRTPDHKFYMYSFSLDPEGDSPAGHVNFSRIKNQVLELTLNPSTANRNISVYAVSYNFLEFEPGQPARILFNNFET